MNNTCLHCGNDYEEKHNNKTRFCSVSCSMKDRHKNVIKKVIPRNNQTACPYIVDKESRLHTKRHTKTGVSKGKPWKYGMPMPKYISCNLNGYLN